MSDIGQWQIFDVSLASERRPSIKRTAQNTSSQHDMEIKTGVSIFFVLLRTVTECVGWLFVLFKLNAALCVHSCEFIPL